MTKSCCAPGCKNGYKKRKAKKKKNQTESDDAKKVENEGIVADDEKEEKRKISMFEFPDHKTEQQRRVTWIARVPRDNWHPKEDSNIFLCEEHFLSSDIVSASTDSNPRRKRKRSGDALSKKRLKDDAVPCIWPGLPAHLTKLSSPRPTSCTSSESRQENTRRLQGEAEQERVARDTFNSLDELVAKEGQLQYPADVFKVVRDNYVLFYKLDVSNGSPNMKYTVQVFSDLSVVLCFENERISISQVRSLDKQSINTCTSLNQVFNYLESIPTKLATKEEIIDSVIEKLKDSRFENNDKISFLVEQLSLVFKKPNARRYSPSMLAMTALIQRISPACYKQLYSDGFLTLPSPGHLRRLCSAIDVDAMTLNESAVAYITARYKKIPEKDRVVSVLMDEVYSHQAVQYVNGKFFGAEGGEITKTMLCVMMKSIAGKYRDVVAMAPVVNINADKLHSLWTDVVNKVTKIGFDVAVTMTDGHSSNMCFFNKKILKKPTDVFALDEFGSKNFPMYDNTHLFKNMYNNWSNYETFTCPPFPLSDSTSEITASFAHLKELHSIEKGKHQKMAYKLTEQVLHPKPIEKTNVKLADAAFHESTINALRYHASRGYPHFEGTANFAKIVRDWFNTINVKSKDYGTRTRDDRRTAIHRATMEEDLSYISSFGLWLTEWKDSGGGGLSKQTFECAIRSCNAIVALVPYLFERYPEFDFILLGNISSDFLEGRFGWWRQLCGGNYYNSVTQFLQAEKTIRLRSLVSVGYNMKEIHEIFSDSILKKTVENEEEINMFLTELEDFRFNGDSALNDADKSLLYYIAGYIAKASLSSCDACNDLISPGKVPLNVSVESTDGEVEESALQAREAFISAISRGGLTKPSDYLYISSVHAAGLYSHIFKQKSLTDILLATENPRSTFIHSFMHLAESDELTAPLLQIKCDNGHCHTKCIRRVAFTIFNISAKNYASKQNDELRTINATKRSEKRSKAAMKIKKLQSK